MHLIRKERYPSTDKHKIICKSRPAPRKCFSSSSSSKGTMTDEIVAEFDKLDFKQSSSKKDKRDDIDNGKERCKGVTKDAIAHYLLEQLLEENTRSLLDVLLNYDNLEEELDTLVWDPDQIPENQVVDFLKEFSLSNLADSKSENVRCSETIVLDCGNIRQRDCETALACLKNCGYNTEKALQIERLGKFGVFVEEESVSKSCGVSKTEGLQAPAEEDLSGGFIVKVENDQKLSVSQNKWTSKTKMNFEKGLILFGENVDKVCEHFSCFSQEKPIDLDLYLYSDERQKFIGDPEISRRVVAILDQTSHKHLQSIEVFEVGMDWARMRQNVVSSSSGSEGEVYSLNKFGRTIKTVQRRKKRPKRLPNRFSNFHM